MHYNKHMHIKLHTHTNDVKSELETDSVDRSEDAHTDIRTVGHICVHVLHIVI